jgi:hypothetical protein
MREPEENPITKRRKISYWKAMGVRGVIGVMGITPITPLTPISLIERQRWTTPSQAAL